MSRWQASLPLWCTLTSEFQFEAKRRPSIEKRPSICALTGFYELARLWKQRLSRLVPQTLCKAAFSIRYFLFFYVLSGSQRNLQVNTQVYSSLKVASIMATQGHVPLQTNCQWEQLEKPLEGRRKPIFLSTLPQRQLL